MVELFHEALVEARRRRRGAWPSASSTLAATAGGLFVGGLAGGSAGDELGGLAGGVGRGGRLSLTGDARGGRRLRASGWMLIGVTATTVYGFAGAEVRRALGAGLRGAAGRLDGEGPPARQRARARADRRRQRFADRARGEPAAGDPLEGRDRRDLSLRVQRAALRRSRESGTRLGPEPPKVNPRARGVDRADDAGAPVALGAASAKREHVVTGDNGCGSQSSVSAKTSEGLETHRRARPTKTG